MVNPLWWRKVIVAGDFNRRLEFNPRFVNLCLKLSGATHLDLK